jgi:Xaa-Pro dipeptidase
MKKEFADSIKEVLDANGVGNEKVGFDFYDAAMLEPLQNANINFVDGRAAMFDARYLKTQDELQLLRIASQIADAGFYRMEEVIRPGMREVEVWGETVGTMIALGADRVRGICTSGGRTNPYYRPPAGTDRILSPGDLLISDIVASYMGYNTCVVRTFLVGDKPTSEQKALYRKCYESLYSAINTCKAGAWTDEIAETFPKRGPEDLSMNVGHGLGLDIHELPHIAPMEYAKDFAVELKPNVYLAIETYAGELGGSQGVRLEEDFVVTEEGYEVFSRYPFDERML